MTFAEINKLPLGDHAIVDTDTHQVIVHRSAAGWTEEIAWKPGHEPQAEPVTLWPYEFQELLTDEQLQVIQLSTEPMLIRMRTKVQTIVSAMPFGEGSELYAAVGLLGMLIPEVFPPSEVARILAMQPPK